jgi:hypothetical protein
MQIKQIKSDKAVELIDFCFSFAAAIEPALTAPR